MVTNVNYVHFSWVMCLRVLYMTAVDPCYMSLPVSVTFVAHIIITSCVHDLCDIALSVFVTFGKYHVLYPRPMYRDL